eukprot:TRINITY_DN17732_c0_g1_i1.p1 TRINITY_DN17732_c0_g1~~TRINITY_DN17732_c0_g1_i1.p1  ORF type:complete len:744 (-),score=167.40 TRINITY_DN17732_c0_g1_i1:40-2271(-)
MNRVLGSQRSQLSVHQPIQHATSSDTLFTPSLTPSNLPTIISQPFPSAVSTTITISASPPKESALDKENAGNSVISTRNIQNLAMLQHRRRAQTGEQSQNNLYLNSDSTTPNTTNSKALSKARQLQRSNPRGMLRYVVNDEPTTTLSPPTINVTTCEITPPSVDPEIPKGGRVYFSQNPPLHQTMAMKKLHTTIVSELNQLEALISAVTAEDPLFSEDQLQIAQRLLTHTRKILDGSRGSDTLPIHLDPATLVSSAPLAAGGPGLTAVAPTTNASSHQGAASPPQPTGRGVPRAGSAALKGKRKTMEDVHCVYNDLNYVLPNLGPMCSLYGVFDGHNGTEAALLAKELLPRLILSDPFFLEGDIVGAIRNAFLTVDRHILLSSAEEGWNAGCTAAIVLLISPPLCHWGGHFNTLASSSSRSFSGILYAANAGDAEVVAGLRNRSSGEVSGRGLSVRHQAKESDERARITACGGVVLGGRLFGDLAVSRALGDGAFKKPACEHDFVSAEPHVDWLALGSGIGLSHSIHVSSDIDEESGHYFDDETVVFFIIACDGVWDVMSHDDAVQLVTGYLKTHPQPDDLLPGEEEAPSAAAAASLLAEEAIRRGSTDNVSAVVVILDEWYEPFDQNCGSSDSVKSANHGSSKKFMSAKNGGNHQDSRPGLEKKNSSRNSMHLLNSLLRSKRSRTPKHGYPLGNPHHEPRSTSAPSQMNQYHETLNATVVEDRSISFGHHRHEQISPQLPIC